jgi:hypothetical protein
MAYIHLEVKSGTASMKGAGWRQQGVAATKIMA